MRNKISIAVFTSIRSEYGVLLPLLKRLRNDDRFSLSLLVSGSHLMKEHGETVNEILKDGFKISQKFPFLSTDDSSESNIHAMSLLQSQMCRYLVKSRPDVLLVVGDRFELISVVTTALMLDVPIAHVSGGDVTEGAIDNQIRHAITKLSHVHFTGTVNSRNNVLRMGEENWRVVATGELGIDCIKEVKLKSKASLFRELGLELSKKTVIATFHPETIHQKVNGEFIAALFKELLHVFPDYQWLVTSANFDNGGNEINRALQELSKNSMNIFFVPSLGQVKYYSILHYADFMLGNSSSGIIEAQSFGLAVVNVGDRQKGRERNVNTIDVDINIKKIINACLLAASLEFQSKINHIENIYGDGRASAKIIEYLSKLDFAKLLSKKSDFK